MLYQCFILLRQQTINVSYYYVNKLLMFHITTEAATGGVLDLMS